MVEGDGDPKIRRSSSTHVSSGIPQKILSAAPGETSCPWGTYPTQQWPKPSFSRMEPGLFLQPTGVYLRSRGESESRSVP
jgi:hypothetical protein